MQKSFNVIVYALLLFTGLSGAANAGEIEKHSLPLAATDFSCIVVNQSDRTIDVDFRYQAAGAAGLRTIKTVTPNGIDGLAPAGPQPNPLMAYCRIRYTGRPADIVGTFCAVSDLGTCTYAVPLE